MGVLDGLLGQPQNYGGLLDQNAVDAAQRNARMAVAAQLLQASGPSTQRTSFGQNLGGAITAGMAAQGNSTSEAIKAKLVQAQIAKAMAPTQSKLYAVTDPQTGKTVYKTAAEAAGMQTGVTGNQPKDAASIQEYKLYQGQTQAAGQQPLPFYEWLRERTNQTTQTRGTVHEIGGVQNLVTTQGQNRGVAAPLSTLQQEATGQATVAGAKAGSEVRSKAQAEAQVSLGSTTDEIQRMRDNIKGFTTAPGFDTVYGLSGKTDLRNYVPGTDAANAQAMRDQLDAMSFGVSIQKMRGLGQLSDAEGKRVTAAFTRATNPKLSSAEARKAWNEVVGYLDIAEQRAKEKAGVETPTAQPKRSREDVLKQYGVGSGGK